ncbi:hypothetical protein K431DRAFT_281270 [Polychaeton citri CBS 116435]|uniref:F-box domain-containing protein n=1 Tax=Polychaeton citri CBS 116435 TaxID=1314669 RepID=A0A9P4QFJ1_9PEZI|nr:hypothetical protein K431DRAFT_281270 [Polychaeton citri CBS 116435]
MATSLPSHTLLTLPSELRIQIYTTYILSLYNSKLDLKSDSIMREPALTRTCHQLRSETLPILYSLQRVSLYALIKRAHSGIDQRISYERRVWHERLLDDKLGMLRRLKIVFYYRPQYGMGVSFLRVIFDVDLFRRGGHQEVEQGQGGSYELSHSVEMRRWEGDAAAFSWDVDTEVARLTKLLKATLEELVVRPGVGNWGREDFDRLAEIELKGDMCEHRACSGTG